MPWSTKWTEADEVVLRCSPMMKDISDEVAHQEALWRLEERLEQKNH